MGAGVVTSLKAALVLLTALVLQAAVVSRLDLFGAHGDLLVLVPVTAALTVGPERGAMAGFAAGISVDLLVHTPFGLTALSYDGTAAGVFARADYGDIAVANAEGGAITAYSAYGYAYGVLGSGVNASVVNDGAIAAYGFYAAAIARTFFPSGDEFASLMLSLATFGAGFLMRPLGAIVLGAYIDHHGRRKGLIVTLVLMALGTLLIALVPGYASIGVAAPLLVLFGRLLQGFSAGVELGGVSVYLSEMATPGNKGFYVSWQSGSQQVAVVFAAFVGLLLNRALPAEDMSAWGWRIPFLIGCLIVPFLFLIRR